MKATALTQLEVDTLTKLCCASVRTSLLDPETAGSLVEKGLAEQHGVFLSITELGAEAHNDEVLYDLISK